MQGHMLFLQVVSSPFFLILALFLLILPFLTAEKELGKKWYFYSCQDISQLIPLLPPSSRSMLVFFVFHHFMIKPKKINGDGVFPGMVLLGTSQEGLCEEEAENKKTGGGQDLHTIAVVSKQKCPDTRAFSTLNTT